MILQILRAAYPRRSGTLRSQSFAEIRMQASYTFIGAFFTFALLWVFFGVFFGGMFRWLWQRGRGDGNNGPTLQL
jgi:hypothetical protein